MIILSNISTIIVGCSPIEQDLKQKGKTEYGKIEAIFRRTHYVLHRPVNPKNPERLYEKVQKNNQHQVGDKLLAHIRFSDFNYFYQ